MERRKERCALKEAASATAAHAKRRHNLKGPGDATFALAIKFEQIRDGLASSEGKMPRFPPKNPCALPIDPRGM